MTIGSNIIFRERLDSTNILASSILKTDTPSEGTVIRAGVQTAGKGQANASVVRLIIKQKIEH